MSRIGKQLIQIPEKTEVVASNGILRVKGPLGELSREIRSEIKMNVTDTDLQFSLARETSLAHALWGTYASHAKNMISGVNKPFEKSLIIEGVGFKAEVSGNSLVLRVGYSHPVPVEIPDGISVTVEKNLIRISGINKEHVGQFASRVRSKKKPEPYKGKGIRYEGEVIRRKQGKKAT